MALERIFTVIQTLEGAFVILCSSSFNAFAKSSVSIPLATAAAEAVSQIPFKPMNSVSRKRNAMGKTSVPNSDTSKERTGRSSAVKNDEKHESTQSKPAGYEIRMADYGY